MQALESEGPQVAPALIDSCTRVCHLRVLLVESCAAEAVFPQVQEQTKKEAKKEAKRAKRKRG